MPYCFRLRVASKQPGKFSFDANEHVVELAPGLPLSLVARNAESLQKATTYHFEAGGFLTEADARGAGEALRVRLRLLNVILGLGLNVPAYDEPSTQVSDEIKEKLAREHNAVLLDGVWGLLTFPDDGRHFECVVGGTIDVRPSDPLHVFSALRTIWPLDIHLDRRSEEALQVIGLATLETSEKAAFLTSYLALEQLIDRAPRGPAAKALIVRFRALVKKATQRKRSPLADADARSLSGALAALNEESFSSALTRFARRVKTPAEIANLPVRRFFSACISARNRIAHDAEPSKGVALSQLTAGLRQVVVLLIWSRNNLPPLTLSTPPSTVSVPEGGLSIRVL